MRKNRFFRKGSSDEEVGVIVDRVGIEWFVRWLPEASVTAERWFIYSSGNLGVSASSKRVGATSSGSFADACTIKCWW